MQGIEFGTNPDVVEALVNGVFLLLAAYSFYLLGAELGGLVNGYKGRGRETHEQLMKQLFDRKKK